MCTLNYMKESVNLDETELLLCHSKEKHIQTVRNTNKQEQYTKKQEQLPSDFRVV